MNKKENFIKFLNSNNIKTIEFILNEKNRYEVIFSCIKYKIIFPNKCFKLKDKNTFTYKEVKSIAKNFAGIELKEPLESGYEIWLNEHYNEFQYQTLGDIDNKYKIKINKVQECQSYIEITI